MQKNEIEETEQDQYCDCTLTRQRHVRPLLYLISIFQNEKAVICMIKLPWWKIISFVFYSIMDTCFYTSWSCSERNSMSGPYTDYICYQHTETGFSLAHNINAEGADESFNSLTGHNDFSRKFWIVHNINCIVDVVSNTIRVW